MILKTLFYKRKLGVNEYICQEIYLLTNSFINKHIWMTNGSMKEKTEIKKRMVVCLEIYM